MAEEYVPGSRVGHTTFEFAFCEDTRNPHFYNTTYYFIFSNLHGVLLPTHFVLASVALPFHHHLLSGTSNLGNPLNLFLPHETIRCPHQMRLSIIGHSMRAERDALAITGEKLPVLAVGPKLAMLFKVCFCLRDYALSFLTHFRRAFR